MEKLMCLIAKCFKSVHIINKLQGLKVNRSRKQILKVSFEQKTSENIFVFLPYLSKMGQIKKMQIIIHIR
jgi:dephospho-CoA kinase